MADETDENLNDEESQVSKSPDSLFDEDDDDMDIDENESVEKVVKASDTNHREARRRLEDYLEQKRLRKELEDDFDY